MENITNFIHELSILDIKNTKELLNKIIEIDKNVSFYLKNKINSNEILKHTKIYNKNKKAIMQKLLTDKDLLKEVMKLVLNTLINHEYDNIKINENVLTRKKKLDI